MPTNTLTLSQVYGRGEHVNVEELAEKRREITSRMQSIAKDKFDEETGRWASSEDRDEWDRLNDEYDAINETLENNANKPGVLARLKELDEQAGFDGTGRPLNRATRGMSERSSKGNGYLFRDVQSGREIRALAPEDKLADVVRRDPGDDFGDEEISVGRCLRALVLNDRSELNRREAFALIGGESTGGGFIVPNSLSTRILDLARAASVAVQSGVQMLPLAAGETTIARILSDPVTQWRPEKARVDASEMSFGRYVMRPKTLACIIPVSIELLEDSSNVQRIIEQTVQRVIALQLDKAVLMGAGAEEEPLGILNHDDAQSIGTIGTPTDYSHATQAVGKILQDNFQGATSELSWITHPRDAETYDGLVDTTGQPLMPTPWAQSLQKRHTTSLPTDGGVGNDESSSIIGAFREVILGTRLRGLMIRVLDSGQVDVKDSAGATTETINAATQLMKLIVCHIRADVCVLRPSWFVKLTGITNS